jgi:hypothetical protein
MNDIFNRLSPIIFRNQLILISKHSQIFFNLLVIIFIENLSHNINLRILRFRLHRLGMTFGERPLPSLRLNLHTLFYELLNG